MDYIYYNSVMFSDVGITPVVPASIYIYVYICMSRKRRYTVSIIYNVNTGLINHGLLIRGVFPQ